MISFMELTIFRLEAKNAQLKARLHLDSHNSSKPSSSDGLHKKPAFPKQKGGKQSGQQGHNVHTSKITAINQAEAINQVKEYKLLLNNHFTLEKFHLFGSYAINTNRADSDVDVAKVVSHNEGDYFSIHPIVMEAKKSN